MKTYRVLVQRIERELKRVYPHHKFRARLDSSLLGIDLYVVKKLPFGPIKINRKVSIGSIGLYAGYNHRYLRLVNKKFRRVIDDTVYEYFGNQLEWDNDAAFKAAQKRAAKPIKIPQVKVPDSPSFTIDGAL